MTKAIVGIIGGSGVYDLPGLEDVREERVATPWGEPSDALRFGRIGATEAVFLPRHGRGHALSPSGINYRANIDALKRAGVTDIVSVSACGSFKEELYPGLFVLIDQFVDRTFARQSSFFGNGCVAHVSMAHPVAPAAAGTHRARRAGGKHPLPHGRDLCLHGGPAILLARRIATLQGGGLRRHRHDGDARSQARARGRDLLRHGRDGHRFDCWHPDHDDVDVASVIKVVYANAGSRGETAGSAVA